MTSDLTWDDLFLHLGILSAGRSKDAKRDVGCVITHNNKILGVGYNGTPKGFSDDEVSWDKHGEGIKSKFWTVIHAEENALTNARDRGYNHLLKHATVYTPLQPCGKKCAPQLNSAEVKRVVYSKKMSDGLESMVSNLLLEKQANVEQIPLNMSGLRTVLDNWYGADLKIALNPQPDVRKKRENYLSWQEYFTGMAHLIASKTMHATVIVNQDNRISDVLYGADLPIQEVARAKAYASDMPSNTQLEALRDSGVDNLYVDTKAKLNEQLKEMSIRSFPNPDRKDMIQRIANEMFTQYQRYTGIDAR